MFDSDKHSTTYLCDVLIGKAKIGEFTLKGLRNWGCQVNSLLE